MARRLKVNFVFKLIEPFKYIFIFYPGAIHGDESMYLLKMTGVNDNIMANSAEDRIMELMV